MNNSLRSKYMDKFYLVKSNGAVKGFDFFQKTNTKTRSKTSLNVQKKKKVVLFAMIQMKLAIFLQKEFFMN